MQAFLHDKAVIYALVVIHSVMSNSLQPHGLQHIRLPCSSLSPGGYSDLGPLSQWRHSVISSSLVPFSSCPQSFPASESFPMSWLFASGDQSFSCSISLSNKYSGLISFRIDWFDLLAVQGTLKSLFQHHSSKTPVLLHSAFFMVCLSHPYMTTGKTIVLTRQTFVSKVISLLFNMLPRFFITFIPKSKHLLISGPQSLSTGILEPKKMKSVTVSIVSPSICHEVIGIVAMILIFKCWILSQLFHSPLSLSSSSPSTIRLVLGWCHLNIWSYWYFSRKSWFQSVIHLVWYFTQCTLHIS